MKHFSQALQRAEQDFAAALDQLVATPLNIAASLPALENVAELLEKVKKNFMPIAGDEESKRLLRQLQANTKRAQVLLDSAANFYCGSISVALRTASSYRPDGEIYETSEGGCIQLQA